MYMCESTACGGAGEWGQEQRKVYPTYVHPARSSPFLSVPVPNAGAEFSSLLQLSIAHYELTINRLCSKFNSSALNFSYKSLNQHSGAA